MNNEYAQAQPVAKAFGAVLREARRARGMSQEALAGDAEVDRTYPSLLERGHRVPTLCVFLRLARALHLAPAELVNATLARLAHAGCAGAYGCGPAGGSPAAAPTAWAQLPPHSLSGEQSPTAAAPPP